MNFITATNIHQDHGQMTMDADTIIAQVGWGDKNQIMLNSRPGDLNPWYDGAGKSVDKETRQSLVREADFTVWNHIPSEIKNSVIELADRRGFTVGRVRIMRLNPRCGLSVHSDLETRYHYVLKTNPKSYFGLSHYNYSLGKLPEDIDTPAATCWHIPADGQWYHVKTTEPHFVYNGGDTERIHLVVCAVNV